MKTNKLSLCIIIFGLAFALLSAIRYYVFWTDYDKVIVYCIIGAVIAFMGYVWDEVVKLRITVEAIEDHLAAREEVE